MSSHANRLYAFEDFRLDTQETVLLRRGKEVAITPKAFQLLSILVENHGVVVKKEKLISEIWSDSIVEEGNLAFTARLLRQALGDNARTPTFIETVPRKGYRFIADVSEPPPTVAAETIASNGNAQPTNGRGPVPQTIAIGLIAVVLIALGGFLVDRYALSTASAPVLTMPFKVERISSTGNAALAAISPNGRLIAYTDQNGNGKWSIWLRQVSTAENIQIVDPADVFYGGLMFSRDNNALFLVRGERGTKRLDIYRVNVFGGVLTKLIEGTEGWISVSPDDKEISFVRCAYTADDYCSLFVADIDGRNERRIVTRPRPIRIGDNQFSADGRSIAFAAGQSRTGSNNFGLIQVDLSTRTESELTPQRFFNIKNLRWLPGGDELLFTARTYEQQKFSIWKASASTGSVAQLTRDDGNFSGLSLDAEGKNIVATKVDNNFAIYVQDVGGRSASRRLVAPGASCSFTPDGKIVFESKDLDIWMVDADGNNKRQLTNDAASDIKPVVTQDGSSVIFSSNRLGVNHIWRMNIDGSNQKQVTRAEGGYAQFVAADGRSVYYTAGMSGRLREVDAESNIESDLPGIAGSYHAFSPDGGRAASFIRDENDRGELKIGIWDLPSGSLVRWIRNLGDGKSDPVHLEWSADGQSVRYVIRRSGEYEIWKHRTDGEDRSLIANLGADPLESVAIAPGGRSVAVVRGSWLHDAFLITGLKY